MKKLLIYLTLILTITSCATLPKATVEMSTLLESQIAALEQSHLQLINLYFNEREQKVMAFLNEEWYPLYLENFFKEQAVVDIWEQCIKMNDKVERMENIRMMNQVVQEQYMLMRDSLMQPLQTAKKELIVLIEQEYKKALTMNTAITNNVASVNAVQEKRKELLSKMMDTGNIEEKINATLIQADATLDKIKQGIDVYNKNKPTIENAIQKLKK